MNLYLIRHGEAKSKDEDPDRPLTDGGRRAVDQLAGFLAELAPPAEVRHSPKLRARQTAEILAERLGLEDRLKEDEHLGPTDDVASLARELEERSDDLMVVGHLPYVDRLASRLVAGNPDLEAFRFAAAGALCLSRDGEPEDDGGWVVRWLLDPSMLGRR